MEAALVESRGLDHSWDWRALECTLILALAALINGAGNLPTPFIPRGRVFYCPTRGGPEWCPRGPADPRWAKTPPSQCLQGGVVEDMRHCCSEGAVLPWEHPPTASEGHRNGSRTVKFRQDLRITSCRYLLLQLERARAHGWA